MLAPFVSFADTLADKRGQLSYTSHFYIFVLAPSDKRGRLALPILFSKTDETFFGNAIHSCRHS